MYNYFGIRLYTLYYTKIQSSDPNLVVVIRNPIDRMVSAVEGLTPWAHTFTPDPIWFKLDPYPDKKTIYENGIFRIHCKPYMSELMGYNFRIIDFYQLENYISRPKPDNLFNRQFLQSPTTFTKGLTNPKEHYIENSVFSLEDLESEYELYLQIMQTKEQISVEEWKNLTS